MIITGLSGNGKRFAIDALRALLKKKLYCTHYLLRLPIRGKRQHDSNGPTVIRLQEYLSNTKYLIIEELSVGGQKMLGWTDRQ